ncbi:MAG: hypothetical protein J6Z49_05485 [Kiritimatiellae bacterium]|nr:hypothetical protein [Kiritimatiellia bacterium]
MSDSFIVKDPSAISSQISEIQEVIAQAKTAYEKRKRDLEEIIAKCRESIEKDQAEKRKCETTLQLVNSKITYVQSQISAIKGQLEAARQSLDQVKSAAQGKYTDSVRNAENQVFRYEREWRQLENKLKSCEAEKAKLENVIKIWENRIACKQSVLDKLLARYAWLTGDGARELDRTISNGNAKIATLRKLLEHVRGRPGM